MLFFPFTTQHYSVDMWAYAAQAGRYGDAAAYYSSLGGVWDFLWLVLAISGWRVFTGQFFFGTVVANDPVWGWLRRRFGLSDRAMLALYRSYFIYGGCRIIAWFIWSRLDAKAPLDWSWGGPYFIHAVSFPASSGVSFLVNTLVGAAGLLLLCFVGWRLLVGRLWARAGPGGVS